jgi:membrane fusion protein
MSDFRPEVMEAKKSSMWGTVLIKPNVFYERAFAVIFFTTFLFILLLFFGRYSTKETVQGLIEPKEGLLSLYAPQTGYIEKLSVQQGDSLQAQETVVIISSKQRLDQGIDYDELLRQQLKEDEQRMLARGKQIEEEFVLKKNEQQVFSTQARLNLNALEQQRPLQAQMTLALESQVNRLEQVYLKGSIPQVQFERAQTEHHLSLKELISIDNNINQLKSKIEAEILILQQLDHDFQEKMLIWEQQIAELRKKLVEIDRNTTSIIYTPFAGLVTQLNLQPGQFVRAGQHIADLQKKDDLFIAKLFVSSKAIGLIKVGQKVSMRVHAFPYEHYGTLLGQIDRITDSLYQGNEANAEPIYVVYVVLDQQAMRNDNRWPLKQGLILDADIKTQEMTIMQKILEPLYRLYQS